MLCVTPNFSTNAYIERMYENPVKIQHIVWLRFLNTVYPIVTESILRGTWKVICILCWFWNGEGLDNVFFFNLYIRLINAFSFRHAFLFDTALIICKTKVSCMTLRTCIYWPIDPNAQKLTISVLVLIVAFFYSEMSEHCHCACLLPHYISVSCLKTLILLRQYMGLHCT